MTSPVPSAPAQALDSLLAGFDRNPVAAGKRLHDLLHGDRAGFLAAAVPLLNGSADTAGRRYLLNLLVASGLLADCLCDRAFTTAQAAALARMTSTMDNPTDLWLARCLAESQPGKRDDASTTRLLEVLEAILERPRAVALLNPLLQHPNARVRSKAALLVGRASRNARWAERQLASPDARVRANAIEALWQGEAESCRPVFRAATRDTNCRVAGNAVVGLYLLGDAESIPLLLELAGHAAPEYRATAAWCMAEIQDPRFLPLAIQLFGESGRVRQNALRAISRMRRSLARMREAGTLQVEVVEVACLGGGARRLRVTVAPAQDLAQLAASHFAVTENGHMVRVYHLAVRGNPEPGKPSRYELVYRAESGSGEPVEITVAVYSQAGWGEAKHTAKFSAEAAECEPF